MLMKRDAIQIHSHPSHIIIGVLPVHHSSLYLFPSRAPSYADCGRELLYELLSDSALVNAPPNSFVIYI
jgi:hypothetical protein